MDNLFTKCSCFCCSWHVSQIHYFCCRRIIRPGLGMWPLHCWQEDIWRQVLLIILKPLQVFQGCNFLLFCDSGTTPHTVANNEWWEETDKKFQAWPRTAGPPVVMNPISRQNFIVKTRTEEWSFLGLLNDLLELFTLVILRHLSSKQV